jgi:hypothetical protein
MFDVNEQERNVRRSEVPKADQVIKICRVAGEKSWGIPSAPDAMVLLHAKPRHIRDTSVVEDIRWKRCLAIQHDLFCLTHALQIPSVVDLDIFFTWILSKLRQKNIAQRIILRPSVKAKALFLHRPPLCLILNVR